MTTYNKDDLLADLDPARPERIRWVNIPGTGKRIGVRMMTAADRETYETAKDDADTRNDVRATMLALTLCGEDGALIFGLADVPTINQRFNGPVAAALHTVAVELNMVTQAAFDEMVGKSTATPSA